MNIKPLGDRIVVKPDEFQQTTASGIVIAGATDTATDTGTVVAVGPEVSDIKPADQILFVKNTGAEIQLDGETYVTLKLEEVVGTNNSELQPVQDVIVCSDPDFGDQQTQAGIIIKSNIKESQGITSRWMRVHKIGPKVDFVKPGQWLLVEYGRWTAEFTADGIETLHRVDPKGCMAVADEKPDTLYYNSDKVTAEKRTIA